MQLKQWPWVPFALFAVAVGLYPLLYCFMDLAHQGLLQSKPRELLGTGWYLPVFYLHISCGGLALLIGWTQFSPRLRTRYLRMHRRVGTVYVASVAASSCAGCCLALFATGGLISVMGFGLLAVTWLFTDIMAYTSIRRLDIPRHQEWMIRNYALTFAAVTLRIYLPLSQLLHLNFLTAYPTIAWLCWVPNLLIAQWIISRTRTRKILSPPSLG
ncbi:MAG TPA: DUF2306 domain-containing protein [Puia sp.]|jgi:uncharacterized membrane protein|nr:DUF2306 domain-containing protein [Puia sp.]